MEYKLFSSFIKGLIKNDEIRTRIGGDSVLGVHNMDIDVSGQLIRRDGYKNWTDLDTSGSTPSSDGYPVVNGSAGFEEKVQAIFPFTDLNGGKYLFIVSNNNIYVEEDTEEGKSWTWLNPTGKIIVSDKTNTIDIVPYLDSVFINDYRNNVLMYDTSLYSLNQSLIVGASYIYFSGQTIRFRDSIDYSDDSDENVLIENAPSTNIEGTQIYNSFVSAGFFGGAGNPANETELNLGYSLAIGSPNTDYEYYVLENQLGQRAGGKINLYRLDANLRAVDNLQFDLQTNGKVLSMGYYNGFIYLWAEDGVVNKISLDFASNSIMAGDIASSTGITNDSGDIEYHVEANERGIFLYTSTVSDRNDWFQPAYVDDLNFTDDEKAWDTAGGYYDFNTLPKTTETYSFVFAKELIEDLSLNVNRNFYSRTNTTDVPSSGDPGAPPAAVAVFQSGARAVAVNTDEWYDASFGNYAWDGPAADTRSTPNGGAHSRDMHHQLNGGATGIFLGAEAHSSRLFVSAGAETLGDTTVNAPATATVWSGHEILTNFTYTEKRNKISVFEFRAIESQDINYYFDTTAGTLSTFKKFDPSYIENQDKQTSSGTMGAFDSEEPWVADYVYSKIDLTKLDTDSTSGSVISYNQAITRTIDLRENPGLNRNTPNWGKPLGTNSGQAPGAPDFDFSTATFLGWKTLTGPSGLEPPSPPSTWGGVDWNTTYPALRYYDNYDLGALTGFSTSFSYSAYREAALYDVTKKVITVSDYFAYDKERTSPSDFNLWSTDYSLAGDEYILSGSSFNTTYMTSKTVSKYVLLAGFDFNGNYLFNTYSGFSGDIYWRFLFPIGDLTQIKALNPISYTDSKYLYFGNSLINSTAGRDNGYLYRIAIDSAQTDYLEFELRETAISQIRQPIQGSDNWFLIDNLSGGDTATIRIGQNNTTWSWGGETGDGSNTAVFPENDYTDLIDFRANLNYHINKNPASVVTGLDEDRLRYLGTPIAPLINVDNTGSNAANTMESGDQYRYFVVFVFFSGETTNLSPVSQLVEIPNLSGGGGAQDVKVVISGLNLLNNLGVPLYLISQVEHIDVYRQQKNNGSTDFGDINLLARLSQKASVDGNYYYATGGPILSAASPTAGGSGYSTANNVATTGGTGSGLTVDIVASAGAITSITTNYPGTGYVATDVITVSGGTGGTYTITADDLFYPAGTYEDRTRSITSNPFTTNNVQNFPCNHMLVHQNRLVLVNDLLSGNTNTILYSEVDLAQSIDRGNFRDIESGDGDELVRGVSQRDFLYLFKSNRIYAILGDVATGQLVDISTTIGCPFKNMVAVYNDVIYFLNNDGIYALQGRQLVDLERFRLDDLFNQNLEASIDFSKVPENGTTYVDKRNQDIVWHLPFEDGGSSLQNVGAIVYNIITRTFRTYTYADDIFLQRDVEDVSGNIKSLMADYNGRIFERSIDNTDEGTPIYYFMNTSAFNNNINAIRKAYNMVKVSGRQIRNLRISVKIDGREVFGAATYKSKGNGWGDAIQVIQHRGDANEIEIRLEGSDSDQAPALINEILLGYNKLRGLR